jgi:hypothetical protein
MLMGYKVWRGFMLPKIKAHVEKILHGRNKEAREDATF